MSYNTILFDVDGTLCDPGKSMLECARYALEMLDIHETDEAKLHRLIGPPLEHAFRDYYGFDEEKTNQAVAHFREKMQKDGIQLYEAYPGISELLEALQQSGKNLAVVTSKIEHIAREALEKTGLITYFDIICAQQLDIVVEKEAILAEALKQTQVTDKATVVMVGDRRHDVEAANAHGVDSIGVLWGYGSLEELQNEGATHIVKDAAKLKSILLT